MTKAQETQTVILAKVCMREQSASAFGSWAVDNGFEVDLKQDARWGDGTTNILEVTLNGSALTERQVVAFADKVMVAQQQLAPDACADVFMLRLSTPKLELLSRIIRQSCMITRGNYYQVSNYIQV